MPDNGREEHVDLSGLPGHGIIREVIDSGVLGTRFPSYKIIGRTPIKDPTFGTETYVIKTVGEGDFILGKDGSYYRFSTGEPENKAGIA